MSASAGQRLQAIHDRIGNEPLPEWLEAASCGPAVKHLAHLAIKFAGAGGSEADWRAWAHDNVPEASDKLICEATECMYGSGLWPWQH